MSMIPPEVLASWPEPNYVDPVTRGNAMEVVAITLAILTLTTVGLRTYCRHWLLRSFGPDDWLAVSSVPPSLAMLVLSVYAVRSGGLGRHFWDVDRKRQLKQLLLGRWVYEVLVIIASTLTKLSIVFTFRRLSPNRVFQIVIQITAVITLLAGISIIGALLFGCRPLSAFWEPDMYKRAEQCTFDEHDVVVAANIINIITDFWCVVLPQPLIWRVQLPRHQRAVLGILMSLGLLSCVSGCLRLHYTIITFYKSYDLTWEGYPAWLWSLVEIQGGIICTSIPPLRALIAKYIINKLPSRGSKNASGYAYGQGYAGGSKGGRRAGEDVDGDEVRMLEMGVTGSQVSVGKTEHAVSVHGTDPGNVETRDDTTERAIARQDQRG